MRTLKCFLVLFISLSLNFHSSAQIDNPIAGDVLKLLQLLHKDYSFVPEEVRDEELRKDRAEVINTFKKYQLITTSRGFNDSGLNGLYRDLETNKQKLFTINQELKSIEKSFRAIRNEPASGTIILTQLQTDIESKTTEKIETQISINKEYAKIDSKLFELMAVNYTNNTYLKYQLDGFKAKFDALKDNKIDNYISSTLSSSTQKSLPFIGGNFDLQTLIDGLSRFIADRMKAELTNAFISKVQKWIEESDEEGLQAFKILMPSTTTYFLSFQANDLNYFSSTVKDHLELDFNKLVSNIGGLKSLPFIKVELDNNPELKFAFEAIEFIPQLKKITQPNDFFVFFNNSPLVKEWSNSGSVKNKNIANGIKLATLMVNSLTVKENNATRFIILEEISKHYINPDFFMLYFGFLAQQNEKYYNIEFDGHSLEKVLKSLYTRGISPSSLIRTPEDAEFLFESITNICNESQKLAKRIQDIKKASKLNKPIGKDTIISLMKNFVDFFKKTTHAIKDVSNILTIKTGVTFEPKLLYNLTKYFEVADQSILILENLFHKRYANSIFSAIDIVNLITDKKGSSIELIDNVIKDVLEYKTFESIHTTLISSSDFQVDDKIKKRLKKLRQVLFEVSVLAKNSRPSPSSTIANINNAINEINSIESSPPNTQIRAMSTVFTTLVADPVFKKLFLKSQFGSIDWENIGSITQIDLEKIKIKGYEVFERSELVDLKGKLDDLYTKVFEYVYKGNDTSLKAFIDDDFSTFVANHLVINASKNVKLSPQLRSLTYFISDLGNAQDAEQVKAALENFALPVGSYSLKRKSKYNISIGTTPGVLFNFSENFDDDNSGTNTIKSKPGIGFTAPVGLNFSIGKIGKGWSIGLFTPIIDIGALTHYRFDSGNDSEALPAVNLQNILAFGGHLQFGVKGTPLILSAGWQTGPQIRKVDNTVPGGFKSVDSSRWSIGVTIDIPIMNIYTKTE